MNTDKDIFKFGDLYYMCFQGVWFMSASAPTGPWEVADSVPQEIYRFPSSSPAHHVTYVTVEEDNDDDWVDVRRGGRLHRHDGGLGLRDVGLGLVLPAVLRLRRRLSVYYPYFRPTATRPGTTRGPARMDARAGVYGPTAAPASARATTRARAPMRAARRLTARTARAARRRPTTRAPAPTRRRVRVPTSTAAGASTSVQRGDDWAKTNRYTNRQTGNDDENGED